MSEQPLPNFYVHDFDSPQLYNMPIVDGVSCWQLDHLNGDAVSVGGFHGYCGFYSDFQIAWKKDGSAIATFNGFTSMGGEKIAEFQLQIFATSGARQTIKMLR